jgi:hypothetical protein
MKSSLLKGFIIFLIAAIFGACKGGEIYPIIPQIEYESHYLIRGSNGEVEMIGLIFNYKDGDGDIGLEDKDTLAPYNTVLDPETLMNTNYFANNVYVDYLEKKGNNYVPVITPFTTDTLRKEFRVMNITPEGKFKAIRGTIDVQFEPSIFPDRADTIKLKFVLIDRMLHISNIAESGDIVLSKR